MTAPDPRNPIPVWPEDVQVTHAVPGEPPLHPATPVIRAVDGNRAALMLLVFQNVVSALMIKAGVGLGLTLVLTFVATVLGGWLLFRPALQALMADSRWRTPPRWGLALGAFAVSFLASRAFAAAYVTLVPGAADTVPQFLSHGPDLIFLVLGAGLLIPFAEEIAFRGLMMRGHERAAGFMTAALASSFAFGIAHGVPASIVGILPLAYVLARVVQHSGSLWNSVIIHALNNTLSVALGAYLAGHDLASRSDAMDLVKSASLRLPVALGATLFGTALLAVAHAWLTPKPDPVVGSQRGPWLSAAYVVILVFGLLAVLATLPAFRQAVGNLHGIMR